MKGTMFIIRPEHAVWANVEMREMRAAPSLEELQAAVGGYIEAIPGFRTLPAKLLGAEAPAVAYSNEDGASLRLPPNNIATLLWAFGAPAIRRMLLGPVVVLTGGRAFMSAL